MARNKSGVTVVRDRTGEVARAIRELAQQEVLVGVPQGKAARNGALSNAQIGYIHEHGAPGANIPARPHLVPGVRAVSVKVAEVFKKAGAAALEGRLDGAMKALNAAGQVAADSVKNFIVAGLAPPLSGRTLAARRSRGRTGVKPLDDTTQYLRSITHVVRKRGGA